MRVGKVGARVSISLCHKIGVSVQLPSCTHVGVIVDARHLKELKRSRDGMKTSPATCASAQRSSTLRRQVVSLAETYSAQNVPGRKKTRPHVLDQSPFS